jgi:DNA-binding response OmpR family regulator
MASAPPKPSTNGPDTITVMVVEPDVLVRMVVAEYLRECGYKVIEGMSAEDVWAVLNNGTPIDVILANVQLGGGGDGFALARRVREHRPAIDIILTSSAAKVADKAGELCDDGPLETPYHPQEVLRRIHLLREQRRTMNE